MKTNGLKSIRVWALLGLIWAASAIASQAQTLKFSGTLVLGTNNGNTIDPALKNLAPTLKRLLPFSSYSRLGGGSATLNAPGSTTMALGNGYSLKITGKPAGKNVSVTFNVLRGGKAVINATRSVKKGYSTIIGGLNHGNGKIALYISAR